MGLFVIAEPFATTLMHGEDRHAAVSFLEDRLKPLGLRPRLAQGVGLSLAVLRKTEQFSETVEGEPSLDPEFFQIHAEQYLADIHAAAHDARSSPDQTLYVESRRAVNGDDGRFASKADVFVLFKSGQGARAIPTHTKLGMGMLKNRIVELRKARGWSQAKLGERLKPPVDGGQVNKIEKAFGRLDIEWILRMAEALEVDPVEVIDDRKVENPVSECDAQRFIPERGDAFATLEGPERELWRVKTNALDELGLTPGEILLVDTSLATASAPQTGDTVVVKSPSPAGEVMLLRVFLEPSLLVTNSVAENAKPVNMKANQVKIIGRVINHLRTVRPTTRH